MPNSLRCKIKHLCHNGTLTERERDRILKALEQEPKWIPVSEGPPDNTDPVNITWVNHDPESYYADIKDKPFTATGCYCDGKWYWYSVTCQDYLDEYGRCDVDAMDEAIEVIAWMPLPKPYKAESEEKDDMDAMLERLWNDVADEESEVEVCSSNFIQLKQDVLNNKQLWRKLREIEDEDSD